MGTPRKAKPIDLPVMFAQPKVHDASEIDNKMKEIMRLSGVLCIDGKVIYFYLAQLYLWQSACTSFVGSLVQIPAGLLITC